jgi:hypothetical protein
MEQITKQINSFSFNPPPVLDDNDEKLSSQAAPPPILPTPILGNHMEASAGAPPLAEATADDTVESNSKSSDELNQAAILDLHDVPGLSAGNSGKAAEFHRDELVQVVGLKEYAGLNGKIGKVVARNKDVYSVKLDKDVVTAVLKQGKELLSLETLHDGIVGFSPDQLRLLSGVCWANYETMTRFAEVNSQYARSTPVSKEGKYVAFPDMRTLLDTPPLYLGKSPLTRNDVKILPSRGGSTESLINSVLTHIVGFAPVEDQSLLKFRKELGGLMGQQCVDDGLKSDDIEELNGMTGELNFIDCVNTGIKEYNSLHTRADVPYIRGITVLVTRGGEHDHLVPIIGLRPYSTQDLVDASRNTEFAIVKSIPQNADLTRYDGVAFIPTAHLFQDIKHEADVDLNPSRQTQSTQLTVDVAQGQKSTLLRQRRRSYDDSWTKSDRPKFNVLSANSQRSKTTDDLKDAEGDSLMKDEESPRFKI